jgi:hypothetical protein
MKVSLRKRMVALFLSLVVFPNIAAATSTALSEGTINLFLPNDVLEIFNSATKKQKLKYCKTGKQPYEKLRNLALDPPKRIFGYNSRMDNVSVVEGGAQLAEMVNLFSTIYMDQLLKQNENLQQIALDTLYQWAKSSALLETKSCVNQDGIANKNCKAWTQSDGQDPSDFMDYNTTQIALMHLAYGYYFTLASFKPDDPKHVIIQNWFNEFIKRNRKPSEVDLGLDLNYYWPKIFSLILDASDLDAEKKASQILQSILPQLDPLLLDDGSIKNRTTRGNKGLWYHHSSLAELLVTYEMARRFDLPVSDHLMDRIEKAGEIFLEAFLDHSYLDKWAETAYRSIHTAGKQEFLDTIDIPNGNSWFYIYIFRFPDSEVSKRLQQLLDKHPRTSRRDGLVGFGLGCIYAIANEIR